MVVDFAGPSLEEPDLNFVVFVEFGHAKFRLIQDQLDSFLVSLTTNTLANPTRRRGGGPKVSPRSVSPEGGIVKRSSLEWHRISTVGG